MDDELQNLEAELKKLRPRAPSRPLPEIARNNSARWRIVSFVAVPLASAAALILTFARPKFSPEKIVRLENSRTEKVAVNIVADSAERPAEKTFRPIAAENVLLNSKDEGVVTLADGTPARRLRETYVDTITWRDSRTNASLKWSLPREEIRVVPVALQ